MTSHDVSQDLQNSFHLFWDNFPFPVLLVHKDRTILDRNKTAEAVGYVAGARCADLGSKEDHKGCLANQALKEGSAKRVVGYLDAAGAVLDSYWIPLSGSDEIYLHFATDITPYTAERMFPGEGAGAKEGCSSCGCS